MSPLARLIALYRLHAEKAAERRAFRRLVARRDARLLADAGLTLADAALHGLYAPEDGAIEPRPVRNAKVLPFRPRDAGAVAIPPSAMTGISSSTERVVAYGCPSP